MGALILQNCETEDLGLERPRSGICCGARLLALALLGLALLVAASPALAYMGGPIRAHIGGLEPGEQRVYYFLTHHGGAAIGPRVWYFDLDGASPDRPRRARYFDGQDGGFINVEDVYSDEWRSLAARLAPLPPLTQFNLRMSLSVDSAGQDSFRMSPRYEGHLVLEAGDMGQTIDVTLYCEPMIRVRGPYGIPGRPEAIVVVTYRGQAYGCEEIEQPVLLVPGGNHDHDMKMLCHEVQPAAWDVSSRGRYGGQFVGRFGEVGPSEEPVLWYLFQDYFSADPPKVWLVGLENNPPMQPVRYGMPEADSVMGAWEVYSRLTRLGGRRTQLCGIYELDLTLRLETDSVGVDSMCGVVRYEGRLVAETADGVGAIDLTMFCSTLIHVRGVFGLPDRSEVALIVSYNGIACECGKEDTPLVIYPSKAWLWLLEEPVLIW